MLCTGVDLVEIPRIQRAVVRWGERFLQRVFTHGELRDCGFLAVAQFTGRFAPSPAGYASLAARWAAKEAAAKALGVGLRGLSAQRRTGSNGRYCISWTDIEVVRSLHGQPVLLLHGTADQLARQRGLGQLALSISHTRAYAIASVIGMGDCVPPVV